MAYSRAIVVAVLVAVVAPSGVAQDVPSPRREPRSVEQVDLPSGLSSPDPLERIAALSQIAASPSPRAIEAVAALLVDRDQAVRIAAVDALVRLRIDLVGRRHRLVRIFTLADLPTPLWDPFAISQADEGAPLLQDLADADAEVRRVAVRRFCRMGDKARPDLEELLRLRSDPAPAVRAALVAWIANIEWNDAVRATQLLLLKDEVASVRAAAATSLGVDRGDPELIAALRGAVQDPEAEVRAAVLRALWRCGKGGDAATLDVLASTRDRAPAVRAAAFEAMALLHLRDARALREVTRGLCDRDAEVLAAAAMAACWMGVGCESELPRLLELTRHPQADVRTAALRAALAVADPARRGAPILRLVEALADTDKWVRYQAAASLRHVVEQL